MPTVNQIKTLLRDYVVFHWDRELLETRQVSLLEINLQPLVEEVQRCKFVTGKGKFTLFNFILYKNDNKLYVLLTPVVSVLVGKDLLGALWERDFLEPSLCIGKISNKFLLEQQCYHNRK